jgi:predicted hydrolase (HD superfamily)
MTIEDDEVSLGYLLDPCFELSNSEGKPLTGGYIELYIHGTRNKYYAASDFEGTLHPFQIPLDSLGSNIVLVSPSFSYDIYVYNRFGNLVMSRYNVCAIGAGGGSASTVSIESSDGTVEITATSSGYDLSVMDLYEAIQAVTASYATIEYVDNSVSSFVTEERVSTMIDEALSGYEPGEIYTGGQYVQITDENVINVTGLQPAGNYLTPEDLNGYATIQYVDNSVSSFTTHTEVYEATVTAIQAATAQMPGQLEAGDYVSIVNNTINVTGLQPAGDYATNTEVNEATVTAIQTVTGLIPAAQVQSDWAQSDDTKVDYIKNKPAEQNLVAGTGIDITVTGNNVVISSTNEGVTEAEVYNATVTAIEHVTAMIPEAQVQSNWTEADPSDPSYIQNKPTEKQLVAGDGISITSNATGVIINSAVTSIEGYATEEYVTAAVAGKKDKQNSLSFTNSDTWTVTGVYQDANGEIEVEWAPIPLDGFITEEQLIEAVSAVTGIGDYGRFYATDISGAATLQKVRGTLDVTNDGKIQLKQGGSYHVTVRGGYNQSVPTNEYTTANYIEYVTNSTIAINVDNTVTATQYFEISYDIYPLVNDTNYYVFFSLPSNATITNLNIDVHAIGQVGTGSGGGGGSTEYDAGWGIQILNNVISVDPDIIPVVSNFATEAEVYDATVTAIEHVTALIPAAQVQSDWTEDDSADPSYIQNKPSEKQLVAGDNISITSNTTGVIISATGGGDVTEAMLYDATVTAVVAATGAIPEQVQSDWAEDNTSDPSYIQNKPEEKVLAAGNNITITETATAFVINATNIPVVTGYATETEVYDAVVTGVQLATGLIPDVSDMATQTWVGNQGYLTEVPSTYATDTEVSEAIASSVTGFMTEEQVTALIPDTEEVEFEELDITQFAQASAIPDVSNLASKAEVYDATVTGVQTATGWVNSQGYLTSVPSTYATDTEVSEAIASSITDFVTEPEVTALLPDTEAVDFEELDISAFALASSVPTVQLNGDNQVTAINNHEIAGGGGGSTYTAGQYISIDSNDVISVTGVAAATAIPDVSDMATKTWVGNQGYLTSIPSSYATDIEVSQAIASSVSGFVTEPEVTALIPETKEITFKEVNLSDFALASSVTAIPMSNVITTAGITDIQMVTALPQDPVSSVLYIIPEA